MTSSSRTTQLKLFWTQVRPDMWLRGAGLLFLGLAVIYLFPLLPAPVMTRVDNVAAESLLLLTTIVLFVTAALRGRDTAARSFWWLMSASFGCWLLAQVVGFFLRAESPWLYDFVKDLLLLAHSCIVVVAADLRPGRIKSPMQTLRARLAAISSMLLIVGIFGYTALVPALSGIRSYESPYTVYAVLDAYIALRFLVQGSMARSRAWRSVMLLIAAGFGLVVVADLQVWLYESGIVAYQPGQPMNLVWYLFYLPLFMASRIPAGAVPASATATLDDDAAPLSLLPILAYSIAIPLIHLGGYGFGMFTEESRGARDLFVLTWMSVAAAGLTWQYLLLRARLRKLEDARRAAENEAAELQAQLRQAQRIEMVGQLSGGLAHEFGNSLFGAESLARKIFDDATGNAGTIQQEHARSLVDALAGSRELVRKFNYLGRGDDVESAVVNVVDEVRQTIDLVRPGISKDIRISFHSDGEDVGAIARKQDLQQITLNLMLNARDAIGEKGFIDVHVGHAAPAPGNCTSCGAMITGDQVWLRVSDSGTGVPDSLRRRIFEPLVTSKPPGEGSGLGLSIVHALVHQLRGHIVLGESRQAHCSFTILLPAVQLDVSGPLYRGKSTAPHALIVESDQVIADAFRAEPSLHGLHINRVTSIEAAEIILRQPDSPPDTVIIGNMHNPLDVIAVIEAASKRDDCRVILCAKRSQRAILESVEGIDTFLDQPVTTDLLSSVVLKAAAG